jgi:hypothetical protein
MRLVGKLSLGELKVWRNFMPREYCFWDEYTAMCGSDSTTARKQTWFCPWGRSNFCSLGSSWKSLIATGTFKTHYSLPFKVRYHKCKYVKRSEMRILVPEKNSNIDKSWFWRVWGSFRVMNSLESLHVWLIKNVNMHISRLMAHENTTSTTECERENRPKQTRDIWIPRVKKTWGMWVTDKIRKVMRSISTRITSDTKMLVKECESEI